MTVVLGWLASAVASPPGLVVHEWGTFTAVAGRDGAPVTWAPLGAATDLPDFVYGPNRLQEGQRDAIGKGQRATIRMETPVLYFYTPVEQRVSVAVSFVDGQISEWYPRVSSYTGSGVDWGTFLLVPRGSAELPHDGSSSHYYPARAVESALVQVCGAGGDEVERFLFYRGVGTFAPSIAATADARQVRSWTPGDGPATAVWFERRGDRVGFAEVPADGVAARPVLDDTLADVTSHLAELLVDAGLYRPEALAMIETWKGDWFEDGLRVLYLVPRSETDRRLPLTVSPTPSEVVRVLVGRLEVPTPEDRAALAAILDRPDADPAVLTAVTARFGRFAEPWLAQSDHPRAARLLPPGGSPSVD
ncbi:MAG: hypothetical protein ABMA64_19360 [Myxococcota bacterium]